VKRYSFKLSQRKEIEEVFADTSKISKYNNFGMEVLFFVYNDYFTYQANYQGFADAFLSLHNSGVDLQGGSNANILHIKNKGRGSRSECMCELRTGLFLVDEDGNIIREYKDGELTPGGPGNGSGGQG